MPQPDSAAAVMLTPRERVISLLGAVVVPYIEAKVSQWQQEAADREAAVAAAPLPPRGQPPALEVPLHEAALHSAVDGVPADEATHAPLRVGLPANLHLLSRWAALLRRAAAALPHATSSAKRAITRNAATILL
ncbi:hypothetical protein EON68_01900, partial [archaeon]